MILRLRDARSLHEAHAGPSMTPMVDVVLVILIFFMASAAFLASDKLHPVLIPPPPSAAPDPFALPALVLRVELRREAGRTIVSGGGLTPPGESAPVEVAVSRAASLALRVDAGSARISLGAADDVPYADLMRVRDALARAGFEQVALVPVPGP
ncbi:MAG: biopolymer transporter ExbD [Phycisphaerales bacterium]|nr:biopolymer transporter ExbD [Phycisphaerales bacterium]